MQDKLHVSLSILKDTQANYKKPVKVADSQCVSNITAKSHNYYYCVIKPSNAGLNVASATLCDQTLHDFINRLANISGFTIFVKPCWGGGGSEAVSLCLLQQQKPTDQSTSVRQSSGLTFISSCWSPGCVLAAALLGQCFNPSDIHVGGSFHSSSSYFKPAFLVCQLWSLTDRSDWFNWLRLILSSRRSRGGCSCFHKLSVQWLKLCVCVTLTEPVVWFLQLV